MIIRKARLDDLGQIKKLHDLYVLDINKIADPDYRKKIQQSGFTVSTEATDVSERVETSQIFNVCEIDNKVVGHIDINTEIYFPENAETINWKNKDLKNIYFRSDDSTSLHHIAVLPEYKGRGIATKLLNESIRQLRKRNIKHLFAIITTSPVKNLASIAFHTKMGFKEVCVSEPINLFGLEDYGSSLFYKKL